MLFRYFGILFFFSIFLFPSISQTVERRPKYAPRKEKHRNASDVKGKQGLWKFYTRNKELFLEVSYENDSKNGPSIKYFTQTGQPREELNYYFGVLEGAYKSYYFSGEVKPEGEYKKNKRDGQWIFYHDKTGEKSSEGAYENGKKNGEWIFYNRKGEMICKGSFVNDTRDGDWVYYDSSGKEISRTKYMKGSIVVEGASGGGQDNKQKKPAQNIIIKKSTNVVSPGALPNRAPVPQQAPPSQGTAPSNPKK